MKLYDRVGRILDVKGHDVWSVPPDVPVFEAVLRMSQAHVGALLVLEKRRLVGIVSERDYARKVVLAGRSSREALVHEIMTQPVITVSPAATLEDCMQLMTSHEIRYLPVLQGAELAGVISQGDLLHWIISVHEIMVDQLQAYIAGRYPA